MAAALVESGVDDLLGQLHGEWLEDSLFPGLQNSPKAS